MATATPVPVTVPPEDIHQPSLSEIEASKEEEQEIQERVSKLDGLVPRDKASLREALENFLLLEPERQMSQLGDSYRFFTEGNAKKAMGDRMMARVNYEIAAKIELYKKNEDEFVRCVRLAREVTDDGDRHRVWHDAMLDDLAQVIRIAKEYYEQSVMIWQADLPTK